MAWQRRTEGIPHYTAGRAAELSPARPVGSERRGDQYPPPAPRRISVEAEPGRTRTSARSAEERNEIAEGQRERETAAEIGIWVPGADEANALAALRRPLPDEVRAILLAPRDAAQASSALVGAAAACAQWQSGRRLMLGPLSLSARSPLRLVEDLATLAGMAATEIALVLGEEVSPEAIDRLSRAWEGDSLEVGEDAQGRPLQIVVHPRVDSMRPLPLYRLCEGEDERSRAHASGLGVVELLEPNAPDGAVAIVTAPTESGSESPALRLRRFEVSA